MIIYIDTETTGLNSSDEIVEIAIVDENKQVLLNTLVKPINHTSWPEAQVIHGISPEDVADAPTYDQIRQKIADAVKGQEVVIYNASYDSMYLKTELEGAASVNCAMEDFAELYGDWNDYHQSYTWQKLTTAAHYVRHEWTDEAHRALADTLATRSVWKYMTDPKEKKKVKAIKKQEALERKQKALERESVWLLTEIESDLKKEETERKKKRRNRILIAIYRWLSPTCYPKVKPDWKEHEDKEYFYYKLLTGLDKHIAVEIDDSRQEGIPIFEGGKVPKGYTTAEDSGRFIGDRSHHALLVSARKAFTTPLYNKRRIARWPILYPGWNYVPNNMTSATRIQRIHKVPKKIRNQLKAKAYVVHSYMNQKDVVALYEIPEDYRLYPLTQQPPAKAGGLVLRTESPDTRQRRVDVNSQS